MPDIGAAPHLPVYAELRGGDANAYVEVVSKPRTGCPEKVVGPHWPDRPEHWKAVLEACDKVDAMLPEQDNGIYLFAMLPEHRAHILEDNERNCQFLSISCR